MIYLETMSYTQKGTRHFWQFDVVVLNILFSVHTSQVPISLFQRHVIYVWGNDANVIF